MRKKILQVEDEEHDVMFLQYALEQAEVRNPVELVRDGREAIAYLSGEGKFGNRREYPMPGLVLLDLRLPRVTGLEVLKLIREQPAFAKLPVLVFSSSDQDADVDAAYRLGADGYKAHSPKLLPAPSLSIGVGRQTRPKSYISENICSAWLHPLAGDAPTRQRRHQYSAYRLEDGPGSRDVAAKMTAKRTRNE